MTHAAPVADMLFVMKELAGRDEIAGLPGYEDAAPETVQAVLEEASKLCGEALGAYDGAAFGAMKRHLAQGQRAFASVVDYVLAKPWRRWAEWPPATRTSPAACEADIG
ncbi:hypothetical protein GNZ11_10325 [Paraburkholderia xenovorans]|nr:hypothetical protein [Paraburkholderia xenovorans]